MKLYSQFKPGTKQYSDVSVDPATLTVTARPQTPFPPVFPHRPGSRNVFHLAYGDRRTLNNPPSGEEDALLRF